MNDSVGRKKADQLNEVIRAELSQFVGEINGPPLWNQVKLAASKALMKAYEAGIIELPPERYEPTITIANGGPDDGSVKINVVYRFS